MRNPRVPEDVDVSGLPSGFEKSDLQDGAEPGLETPILADEGVDIKLTSLLPLLQHAPGLNLQEDHATKTYRIRGRICNSDREDLVSFASRVSQLDLNTTAGNGLKLSPGIFFKLGRLADPLFPCLDRLSFKADDMIFDALEMFLTPSLRSLEISDVNERLEPAFASCIATLQEAAPALCTLSFRDCIVSTAVYDSIRAFQHVTKLELINSSLEITTAFIEDLGKMKSLESLGLHAKVEDYTASKKRSTSITPGLFNQLRILSLAGPTKLLEFLVSCISSTMLGSIVLSFLDISTANSAEISMRIAVEKWINTLVTFAIKVSSNKTLTDTLFTQILNSPALRHLDIDMTWSVTSLNGCISSLSTVKNSQLETLKLPVGGASDMIELSTLEILLDACPNLQNLRCRLEHGSSVPIGSPKTHKLQVLCLENHKEFPESGLRDTARFLDNLCPFLQKIEMLQYKEEVDNIHDTWRQIYQMIRLCQEARASERERMNMGMSKDIGRAGKFIGSEEFVTLSSE